MKVKSHTNDHLLGRVNKGSEKSGGRGKELPNHSVSRDKEENNSGGVERIHAMRTSLGRKIKGWRGASAIPKSQTHPETPAKGKNPRTKTLFFQKKLIKGGGTGR